MNQKLPIVSHPIAIDSSDYLCRINMQYERMSKTQRKIADFFQEHEDDILKHSITTLSKKIGTNPAAITRFCQSLHYKGFPDMKFCLEKEFLLPFGEIDPIRPADCISDIKRKFINIYKASLTDTLLNISDKAITQAAKELVQAQHVYIYSNGSSGASANFFFQLLTQIGVPCNYYIDRQLAKMSISHLKKGDVAIGINFSGDSKNIVDLLSLAKQNGVTIIAVTAHIQSSLAKIADIPLCYSAKIADDIRYMHIARICELSIVGLLQAALITTSSENLEKNLKVSKYAIEESRRI